MKITSIFAFVAKFLKASMKSLWLSIFERASSTSINSGFEMSDVARATLSLMPRLSFLTFPSKLIPRLVLISVM